MTPLPTPCDQCRCGWVQRGDWIDPCTVCGGSGFLTLTRLCEIVEVDEATLKGLWTLRRRTRVRTAQRVLDRIYELTKPKQALLFPCSSPPNAP
jgi:hypothetical protein